MMPLPITEFPPLLFRVLSKFLKKNIIVSINFLLPSPQLTTKALLYLCLRKPSFILILLRSGSLRNYIGNEVAEALECSTDDADSSQELSPHF